MATSNVIAGIVTYNPDIEVLQRNILSVCKQVNEVLLVDNGSKNITQIENLIDELITKGPVSITIIPNENNLGIATALNQALGYSTGNSYMWLLTLDQDSECTSNIVNTMLSAYEGFMHKEKVVIISPSFIDRNSHVAETVNDDVTEAIAVITSGSLTNVFLANKIGRFLDDLFIDHVDHEFCLRARKHSLKTLRISVVGLHHEIGKATTHKFLFLKVQTSNHSSYRSYYWSRNTIYLVKNYFIQEPLWVSNLMFRNVVRIIKIVCFESAKMDKLRKITMGYLHGFRNRYGKFG